MIDSISSPRSVRVGVGILAVASAAALLYYGRVFFITVIVAAIISFLLEPLVMAFVGVRVPRPLASFLVCVMALVALYMVGLGVYSQGQALIDVLPAYGARINALVEGAAARMDRFQTDIYRTIIPRRFQDGGQTPPPPPDTSTAKAKKKASSEPPPIPEVRIRTEPTPFVVYFYAYLRDFYDVLLMASFVPFLVYFILSWRDRLRSRLVALMEGEERRTLFKSLDSIADIVRAYVIGNFLLGLLLSVLSAILFASVRLPYWLLVAPISGFFSLVPYIGLPLAMAPPLLAALAASEEPTLYLFLAVGVAVLHLLAVNFLYPKLVGARVHLNPLVVTIALMFWGMLWGGIGLLLAIPLTAALKAVCDNVATLQPYGRLLGD